MDDDRVDRSPAAVGAVDSEAGVRRVRHGLQDSAIQQRAHFVMGDQRGLNKQVGRGVVESLATLLAADDVRAIEDRSGYRERVGFEAGLDHGFVRRYQGLKLRAQVLRDFGLYDKKCQRKVLGIAVVRERSLFLVDGKLGLVFARNRAGYQKNRANRGSISQEKNGVELGSLDKMFAVIFKA